MTPRSTDWGLALLVALLFATGVMTLFAGHRGDAWIFAVHGAGGFALAAVLGWKLRRVWRRLADPGRWDRRTAAGAAAVTVVAATLLSGVGWSSGAQLFAGGYNLLNWHFALGVVLTIAVTLHAVVRAKPLRRRDLAGRRQFLRAGAIAARVLPRLGAAAPGVGLVRSARCAASLHRLIRGRLVHRQRLSLDLLGRGQPPATERSVISAGAWRLGRPSAAPAGRRPRAGDRLVATLDCTGGFYSRQRWQRQLRLGHAPRRGRARCRGASHVRVISHTGYRWSFELARRLRGLLLATDVGGEALSHEHGAPVRLVAPGRRGFRVGQVGGLR